LRERHAQTKSLQNWRCGLACCVKPIVFAATHVLVCNLLIDGHIITNARCVE
jgi:hypothetical protein